jgi:hypothetical protein
MGDPLREGDCGEHEGGGPGTFHPSVVESFWNCTSTYGFIGLTCLFLSEFPSFTVAMEILMSSGARVPVLTLLERSFSKAGTKLVQQKHTSTSTTPHPPDTPILFIPFLNTTTIHTYTYARRLLHRLLCGGAGASGHARGDGCAHLVKWG